MLVRGSGLGLETFAIPTPPQDYWGEGVLDGQVEGVCVGGMGYREAEAVRGKACHHQS